MPTIRTISHLFAGSLSLLSGGVKAGRHERCPASSPLSCHNTTAITDTCCTNTPGGLALQTQFWDYDPATGPHESWTVHGLWPDNCDGTYQSYCDANRQYTNITQILQAEGRIDLLDYMNKYWVNYDGANEEFWEHEWGKHGTCFSTLDPDCYNNYKPQQEVGQFFNRTVSLFKTLDTYKTLAAAGIVPSNTKTYVLADVQKALTKAHGFEVTIQCDKNGAFDEVWYYYNVKGSITYGNFVPTRATTAGDCPATGLKYPVKSNSSSSTSITSRTATATTTTSKPTSTAAPFTGSGFLNVRQSNQSSSNGCLISYGTWYVSGTCATYHATSTDNGFTLTSSKGSCAINATTKAFDCSSEVGTPSVFTADSSTLMYKGSDAFYATVVAKGSTQQPVFPGAGAVPISIEWS